jgi:hypothetical protein
MARRGSVPDGPNPDNSSADAAPFGPAPDEGGRHELLAGRQINPSRPGDPGRDLLIPAVAGPDDPGDEPTLRPRRLDEFVGQRELKAHLGVILGAAKQRSEAADHLLFAGPPGLGKTTLAAIVAYEMQAELHITSGPALDRAGDLAAILTKLEPGDVLFIDEIHRPGPSKRCSTRRWRTSSWTSSWARGRRPSRCASTCPASRW